MIPGLVKIHVQLTGNVFFQLDLLREGLGADLAVVPPVGTLLLGDGLVVQTNVVLQRSTALLLDPFE